MFTCTNHQTKRQNTQKKTKQKKARAGFHGILRKPPVPSAHIGFGWNNKCNRNQDEKKALLSPAYMADVDSVTQESGLPLTEEKI